MKYFFSLLMLFPFSGITQNLVPNGSFEDTTACPYIGGQLHFAVNWINPTAGTPDLMHTCSVFPGITAFGYQLPHTGNAYAGGAVGNPISQTREYIEVQLLDTLIGGTCYQLSFYASLGHFYYSTDAIHAYFSDTLIANIASNKVLNYTPQIRNQPGNFLDTLNWTLVQGEFMASGGENYLIIGNLDSAQYCNWIVADSNATNNACYILIDDIELIQSTCVGLTEINLAEIDVHPNPTSDIINLKVESKEYLEFYLFNSLSQEIINFRFRGDETVSMNHLANGIYFYQIYSKNGVNKKGKIIKAD